MIARSIMEMVIKYFQNFRYKVKGKYILLIIIFAAIFNILHNCKCQKSYLFLHYLVSDEGDDISH